MKHTKSKAIVALMLLVWAATLCACQKSPEQAAVISKNDGAFEAGITQSASETHAPDATQPVMASNEFYSTDRSVLYTLDLDLSVRASDMPAVKVAPHYLTGEDAKRVAGVLFGGIQGYESPPLLDPQYSKADIRECIARWSPYTSGEGVRELYGEEDEFIMELVKAKIEDLNLLYDSVPDEIVHEPCKWEFQNEVYYTYAKEKADTRQDDAYNDTIMAEYKMNGIAYTYEIETRDKSDFKLNVIFARLNSGHSPMSIDETLYRTWLCRTDKPTEEQIAAVRAKAQDMLDQMGLGEWAVDQCYVECSGDTVPLYIVHVNAVPVLNGVPAAPQPQITNLSSDSIYASNYYMSEVLFQFSANGELVYFRLSSPIDVEEVVNENVAVMSIEELLEIAVNHLKLSDSQAYAYFPTSLAGEKLEYTVNLCDFSYGLLRVRVPETDASYYYVPGVMLEGYVEIAGKESGNTYYLSETAKPLVR